MAQRPRERQLARARRDELDPIAPGIADVESPLRRDLGIVRPPNLDSRIPQSRGKSIELGHRFDEEGRVCLDRRGERILDADVQLPRTAAKPAPASSCQKRRLRDLLEPEEVAVERTRGALAVRRSRNLNMVQPGDRAQRIARPSYSGNGLPAMTRYVSPSDPAATSRVDSASTRR